MSGSAHIRLLVLAGTALGTASVTGCEQGVPVVIMDGGALDQAIPNDARPPSDMDMDTPDVGSVVLEVGWGQPEAFAVATPGATVSAVAGIQGGYHVDMGFRVRGLSAADFNSGEWSIRYELRDAGGALFGSRVAGALTLADVTFDGVGQVRAGDRVFIDDADPTLRDGTTITLFVSLTRTGAVVSDMEEVTLDVP